MDYTIRTEGAVRVAALDGDLGLADYKKFFSMLTELYSVASKAYALDLVGVNSIDSSGLGSLLSARKRADEIGAKFSLHNASGHVKKSLLHAGFDKMFVLK